MAASASPLSAAAAALRTCGRCGQNTQACCCGIPAQCARCLCLAGQHRPQPPQARPLLHQIPSIRTAVAQPRPTHLCSPRLLLIVVILLLLRPVAPAGIRNHGGLQAGGCKTPSKAFNFNRRSPHMYACSSPAVHLAFVHSRTDQPMRTAMAAHGGTPSVAVTKAVTGHACLTASNHSNNSRLAL